MFEKNYQMSSASPAWMRSSQYEALLAGVWADLLDREPSEREVHEFLERHPAMIPGAFGAVGWSSGHAPFPGAVISQPELHGYHRRKPDFMWISKNSSYLNPVLIEIESPRKKIFRKDGSPTAAFTQARNQLAEWKVWFAKPENQHAFLRAYDIPFPRLKLEPHFVLIYGRRSEFEDNELLTRHRAELMGDDEILMSFDRLAYDPKSNQFPSVRHTVKGYEVMHIPPTYWLGPGMFAYNVPLQGRVEAVDRNHLITSERKFFLRNRITYWEEWDRGPKGICSNGDRE